MIFKLICNFIATKYQELYNSTSKGPISTANIPKYVAEHTGKLYLDINTQEDAEEYLSALEMTISVRLSICRLVGVI